MDGANWVCDDALSLDLAPSSTFAFRCGENFGFSFTTFLATVDPGALLFFHERTQFLHVVGNIFPLCSRRRILPLVL